MKSPEFRVGIMTGSIWVGDRIRLGALRVFRKHRIRVRELGLQQNPAELSPRLDGIIAHIGNLKRAEELAAWEAPVVNTSGVYRTPFMPQVLPDNQLIGAQAAEHLLSLGSTRMLYLAHSHIFYNQERGLGFRTRCLDAGAQYAGEYLWEKHTEIPEELKQAFLELGDGGGVLACDDGVAIRCLEWLQDHPEYPELAVLSAHDHGTPSDPMISAVGIPELRWGQEAAIVLLQALHGEEVAALTLIPPSGVQVRGSTSSFQVQDPHLRKAMAFIQDHACAFIQVSDVVEAAGLSRRPLELRMKEERQQTLLQAIHQRQLAEAKRLLIETHEPLSEIAYLSGMSGEVQLRRLFSRYGEDPPGRIRRSGNAA